MSRRDKNGRLAMIRARRLVQVCRRVLRLARTRRLVPGSLVELDRAERRLRAAGARADGGALANRALLTVVFVRDQLDAAT